MVVVADQIVLALFSGHLIGAHHILPDCPILATASMHFLVCTEVQVGERHLFALADCVIQNFNRIEQLLVRRLRVRHGVDMPHMGSEILAGLLFQLLHQLPALTVGYVLGKQEAIDQ